MCKIENDVEYAFWGSFRSLKNNMPLPNNYPPPLVPKYLAYPRETLFRGSTSWGVRKQFEVAITKCAKTHAAYPSFAWAARREGWFSWWWRGGVGNPPSSANQTKLHARVQGRHNAQRPPSVGGRAGHLVDCGGDRAQPRPPPRQKSPWLTGRQTPEPNGKHVSLGPWWRCLPLSPPPGNCPAQETFGVGFARHQAYA